MDKKTFNEQYPRWLESASPARQLRWLWRAVIALAVLEILSWLT